MGAFLSGGVREVTEPKAWWSLQPAWGSLAQKGEGHHALAGRRPAPHQSGSVRVPVVLMCLSLRDPA